MCYLSSCQEDTKKHLIYLYKCTITTGLYIKSTTVYSPGYRKHTALNDTETIPVALAKIRSDRYQTYQLPSVELT